MRKRETAIIPPLSCGIFDAPVQWRKWPAWAWDAGQELLMEGRRVASHWRRFPACEQVPQQEWGGCSW